MHQTEGMYLIWKEFSKNNVKYNTMSKEVWYFIVQYSKVSKTIKVVFIWCLGPQVLSQLWGWVVGHSHVNHKYIPAPTITIKQHLLKFGLLWERLFYYYFLFLNTVHYLFIIICIYKHHIVLLTHLSRYSFFF